jgi:hypothetical protein
MFVPSMGWMWQPGGWNNWLTVPSYTATTLAPVHTLVAPTGTTGTVTVGRVGVQSTLAPSRMTLSAGSAGLFVARGSLDNLRSVNQEVSKKGSVEMRPMPQFAVQTQRRSGFAGSPTGFGDGMAGHTAASTSSMTTPSSSSSAHASTGGNSHH